MGKKTKKNPSGFSSNVPIKNRKGQWSKFTTEAMRNIKASPQKLPTGKRNG